MAPLIAGGAHVDPEELEQLARSPAMAPVLGKRDRQAVIDAPRPLADLRAGEAAASAGQAPCETSRAGEIRTPDLLSPRQAR